MLKTIRHGWAALLILWACSSAADTVAPAWWQRFLPPPGAPAVQPSAAPSATLSADDVAMAQQLIQAKTRTLPAAVPGASVRVGPGPFSAADRLVLFSLKASYQQGLRVPGTWFLDLLGAAEDSATHKKAAEQFWDEYSGTTVSAPKGGLRHALQEDFGWYLDFKMSERLKVSNRQMASWQKGEDVWRRAVESERALTEKWRAREETGRLARDAYLKGWAAEDAQWHADNMEKQPGSGAFVAEAKQKAEQARLDAQEAEAALKKYGGGQ